MEIWENRQLEDLDGEIWLPIKGYEGLYEISNMGRVKSLTRKTKTKIVRGDLILKLKQSSPNGYIQSKLSKRSKFWMPIVSRLVAEHFCNPPVYKWVANHKNCIIWDNRAENLECISQSQNIRYAFKLGRKSQKGIANNRATITMEIAEQIRKYAKENDHLAQHEIGTKFGISREVVKGVLSYKTWNY